jgi:iron complex outermembrane receptor protein
MAYASLPASMAKLHWLGHRYTTWQNSALTWQLCLGFSLGCSLGFSTHATAAETSKTIDSISTAQGEASIERINVSFIEQNYAWLRASAAISYRDFSNPLTPLDSASLLQGIAGLQADQRGNFAQDSRISLRGFGARSSFGVRGLEVTLDGIPLSTPDGQVQPSSLMLGQLQQVEVLKGPFAALYGNASGGVIAFQSKAELEAGVQLQHQQSALFKSSSLVLGSDVGEFAWSQVNHQGFRSHNSAEKRQAYWRKSLELAPNLALSVRYDWSDDPLLQDPLALTESEWRVDPKQTAAAAKLFDTKKTSAQHGLSAKLQFNADDHNWQLASWQQHRKISQFLAFTGEALTSAGGVVDLERRLVGVKGQWQQNVDYGFWQFFGGAEKSSDQRLGFVNQFGNVGALRRDETGEVSSQDVGSNLHVILSSNWDLFAGLRLSQQRFQVTDWYVNQVNPDDSGIREDHHNHWALGSSYQLNNRQSLNFSVGEGFESPTLSEMAYSRAGAGINLALRAAKSQQWQAGWKYANPNATNIVSLDLFAINSQDELLVDQSIGGRTSFRNAAATKRTGAEFSSQWQPTANWQHQMSVTIIDARFDTPLEPLIDNRQLPGLARQQLSWQVNWRPLSSDFWRLQAGVDRKSQMATDDRNQQYAPASTVWRLQSRWQGQIFSGEWQAWLAGDNIGQSNYVGAVVVNQSNGRSFEPGLPRQFLAGIQYNYQLD